MRSLALAALASAACAADSPVFELDESTHAEFIKSPLSVMVKYYAPWCGHCKALVPEYDEAATALSTYQPPMRLGKIDASTHTSVAADQDISGFPTLLVWKDGKSEAYEGERTATKITEYMIEKAPKKEQLFPLFEAVAMQAKLKELEELVEKEPLSPRQTTSPSGMTALMVANSTEVVKLLLDKGADLHAEDNAGNSVLMNQLLRFAQGAKNSATVKSIIDAGAEVLVSTKDNTTSLHLAVMGETTEIAETLVLKGATVDAKTLGFQTPLSFACRHGSIKMVNWLLDRGANPKRAIAAAMDRWWSGAKEGLKIVKLLVAQKAPVSLVNAKDQTPLHVVAAHQTRLNKTAGAIQFLLDHGASVAARDGEHLTPLHHAMNYWMHTEDDADFEVVKKLVEAGSDLNSEDTKGRSAAHYMAIKGRTKHLRYLVDKGLDFNQLDKGHRTPLMFAAMAGDSSVVSALLEHGAKKGARSIEGMLAYDYITEDPLSSKGSALGALLSLGSDEL